MKTKKTKIKKVFINFVGYPSASDFSSKGKKKIKYPRHDDLKKGGE